MTTLIRTKIVSSGYEGGPGVNVLHFSAGTSGTWTQEAVDGMFEELHDLYFGIKAAFPTVVSLLPDPELQEIDVESGEIIGVWTQTGWTAALAGTATALNAPRGQCLTVAYQTDIWHEGKRLRGRSFIGPVSNSVVGDDGQIYTAWQALVADNYVALTSGVGPRLAVFHRANSSTHTGGYYGDVVSIRVNKRPGNLRSRRD